MQNHKIILRWILFIILSFYFHLTVSNNLNLWGLTPNILHVIIILASIYLGYLEGICLAIAYTLLQLDFLDLRFGHIIFGLAVTAIPLIIYRIYPSNKKELNIHLSAALVIALGIFIQCVQWAVIVCSGEYVYWGPYYYIFLTQPLLQAACTYLLYPILLKTIFYEENKRKKYFIPQTK